MKINIVGASNFVNRMFEACGNYQWAREFLKNALEANASRVEFGIEWQAVEKFGIYRRTVIDNGDGMSREELLRFFSTLGEGGKRIGGIHENFGVGAKISSLPWNLDGVVVISYKNGQASMIEIVLDPELGEYELVEFADGRTTTCVVDPTTLDWKSDNDIDWGNLRPDWVQDHGTIVVLKGSEQFPDTVLGNPRAGEADIKGLSVYLNTRFWDLSNVDVRVVELRSEKKNQWPQAADERDDSRRPNNRRIRGARYFLSEVKGPSGRLAHQGAMLLDQERLIVEWYLWEGERPAVHSYAKKGGYIAVRYKDELFELSSGKVQFRWFGVVESAVQQNLTIILEPQLYGSDDGHWGVHPDQSRNRLIFTGEGQRGVALPLDTWGLEFTENMPDEIRDAIYAARGDKTGSIENEEYRKRLQGKFGQRWTFAQLTTSKRTRSNVRPVTPTDEQIDVYEEKEVSRRQSRRKKRKSLRVVERKATEGGETAGADREVPVDVPRYRFAQKDDFERPWHLATWVPNDPDGPTVLVNIESPVLKEIVQFHQDQYPEIYGEEIANTIYHVFGEVAACKVAHSQKLRKEIPEEELDQLYRSEPALTVALMGLIAEESLISQRLGKFGRKKAA